MPRSDAAEWAQDDPPIVHELLVLREPGVWGTQWHPCKVPRLEEVGRLLVRRRDTRSQFDVMTALFNRILRHPKLSEQDREAVKYEYGLALEVRAKSSNERRKAAASVYGYGLEAYRRMDERRLLRNLGNIVELIAKSVQHVELNSLFIPREELYEALRVAEENSRMIALVGYPGMGKSELAKAFVQQRAGPSSDYLIVDASAHALASSLAKQLQEWLPDALPTDNIGRRLLFRDLLCSAQAPRYALLDDVVDPTFLSDVLPPEPTSCVFVTTNDSSILPNVFDCIRVGPMTLDEGAALARRLCSGLTDAKARTLSEELGGHPLAIKQACGLDLAQKPMLGDFLHELRSNPRRALTPTSVREKNLAQIYRRLVRELKEQAPGAIHMLEAIMCLAPSRIPFMVLGSYFIARTGRQRAPTLGMELAKQYVDLLHDRNVIEKLNGSFVKIHGLTQRLLRELMLDSIEDACPVLRNIVLNGLNHTIKNLLDSDYDFVSDPADLYSLVQNLDTHFEYVQSICYDDRAGEVYGTSPAARIWAIAAEDEYDMAKSDWKVVALERLGWEGPLEDDRESIYNVIDALTDDDINYDVQQRRQFDTRHMTTDEAEDEYERYEDSPWLWSTPPRWDDEC